MKIFKFVRISLYATFFLLLLFILYRALILLKIIQLNQSASNWGEVIYYLIFDDIFLLLIFIIFGVAIFHEVIYEFYSRYWNEIADKIEGYVQEYEKIELDRLQAALNFSSIPAVERMIAEINKSRNANLMVDPKTNEVFRKKS
jgi:hypothetical protein